MRDMLDFLFGGRTGYVETRYWRTDGPVLRSWYAIPEGFEDLIRAARILDNTGHEFYVGVLPRLREYAGKAEDVSPYTDLLWADVDANDHDDSKRRALDAVLDFPVAPQVIVDSGRGIHAYWKLDHLYLFDDVQPIMKGIAKRIGGDAVHDRARILRLPGLSNHKDGGNAPVRLLRFDTTSSSLLGDLAEFEYREPSKWVLHTQPLAQEYRWTIRTTNDAAYLDERIDQEVHFNPGRGARSGHDFYVACLMVEAGWDDGMIEMEFLSHPQGVGAKTAEAGPRYLERTIRKARQAVGR